MSSTGRRGVGSGLYNLALALLAKMANENGKFLTFQKLADEAERKYPKKNFGKVFAILASPNFQNLNKLAENLPKKNVVRNDPKDRCHSIEHPIANTCYGGYPDSREPTM